MLHKFKAEIEICGPEGTTLEEVYDFIYALIQHKDLEANQEALALGEVDVYDDGEMSLEEWNRDESPESTV